MPGSDESDTPGSPGSRSGTASSFMTRSTFRGTETFSLEPEPIKNDGFLDKAYPSVCDYYEAKGKRLGSTADPDKPINLLSGLSNYSGLKLGDHRITFGESVLSASYRIPVEHLMSIDAPSKGQTKHTRKREYKAALEKVGDAEINRLERVMKDKLFQRSYATSSPFQVRKAFKFFDRETTLKIPIEGFTRALEFLGFQFAELQNLALFAKYDSDFTGDIDYMTFIASAMFYPAVEPDFGQANFATPKVVEAKVDNSVFIEEQRKLRMPEVKTVFDKVAKNKGGVLQGDSLELLFMALGHNCTPSELARHSSDLSISNGSAFSFDEFFDWYTSPVGFAYSYGVSSSRK